MCEGSGNTSLVKEILLLTAKYYYINNQYMSGKDNIYMWSPCRNKFDVSLFIERPSSDHVARFVRSRQLNHHTR